jgi:hypothetical protein
MGRDSMLNEIMATLDQAGTDALSVAVGAVGSRLATAATKPRGRRAEDLSIARWFETYKLTTSLPDLPGLSAELASRLASVLGGDAVQAALQELLAVRLTDADDVEAGRAREVFSLTLSSADPDLSVFGPPLAEYYDEEISSLVARLEMAEPAILTQIRSEALSARMIAVLRAIERHTAALSARPALRSEASFLASYRGHVLDRHGKLEPPDFDRRRRVPIADIYVPPTIYEVPPIIYENTITERTVAPVSQDPPTLSLWELAGRLDRTVLLGDPGGGKTTASSVLMHHFASAPAGRVPFLVTLRNYAAADPPEYSMVGYMEDELSTFYQCPAPPGLVDMLLLTGRAVVFFDGLDELLDTSRRANVASRVEHFCREYPLAPVVVTSRVVGYDQARLDETQFVSFRLGGFRSEDVAEYSRKWFALEEGARADEADAFLVESESVPDLRANPLLLSLMCILYRGEGSLPRNRAEVYEQCANLLFNRWDTRRHIHQDLRAGHLLQPALQHLAWWIFTRDDAQTSVTERQLIEATAAFLHGRGFEPEDQASDAAREFVEFCRGRMWVLNEAGTTATGQKLYAFTHRTFLEYFAASKLAYDCDTPEKLARTLAPHIARGEWDAVGELAVHIKDATSRDGARRAYRALLDERRRRAPQGRGRILQFLARTLRSVNPSPQIIRQLSRETTIFLFSNSPDNNPILPFATLIVNCEGCADLVSQEISAIISEMVLSEVPEVREQGLLVSLTLDPSSLAQLATGIPLISPGSPLQSFWRETAHQNAHKYSDAIKSAARGNYSLRALALEDGIITLDQALEMSGGLLPLLRNYSPRRGSYLISTFVRTAEGLFPADSPRSSTSIRELAIVGEYIKSLPPPPWVNGSVGRLSSNAWRKEPAEGGHEIVDPVAYLGGAAIALMASESGIRSIPVELEGRSSKFGPFNALYPYIQLRLKMTSEGSLPELPVPEKFKPLFRDWAEGKVNFTAPAPEPLT